MNSKFQTTLFIATLIVGAFSSPLKGSDEILCIGSGEVGADGNGTLPANWYGYLLGADGVSRNTAQMQLDYVDDTPYFPAELGCQMADHSGRAYVAAGWVHVAGVAQTIYAVNAVCVTNDQRNAEVVALGRRGDSLHLLGTLTAKKYGIQFSGRSARGSRFVLVEDRRTQTCP